MKTLNLNINKKDLENHLGYQIEDFKLEPVYLNGECTGLDVFVQPKSTIKELNLTVKILKENEYK